jgi:hypothetical protein
MSWKQPCEASDYLAPFASGISTVFDGCIREQRRRVRTIQVQCVGVALDGVYTGLVKVTDQLLC